MKRFALVLACMLLAAPLAKAGPVGGPGGERDFAFGNDNTSYQVAFVGDEQTIVVVEGDGSSVLDVAIYDQSGNLVAFNMGTLFGCTTIWTPASTGDYIVMVINEGSNMNNYNIDIV